jgi:hypothetical protein
MRKTSRQDDDPRVISKTYTTFAVVMGLMLLLWWVTNFVGSAIGIAAYCVCLLPVMLLSRAFWRHRSSSSHERR